MGTGTGYTAALLKDAVGPSGHVVSVEVDAAVAAEARARLKAAGVEAEVVTGDGLEPDIGLGPFDRIHVTCGIREIPSVWLKLCPTGRITMPWTNSFARNADYLITLTCGQGQAVGEFLHPVAFMTARAQRRGPVDDWPDTGDARQVDLPMAWEQLDGPLATREATFVVGLLLPGMQHSTGGHGDPAEGERVLWLARDGRYASVAFGKNVSTTVAGDGELVADYVAATRCWYDHGRPGAQEFGLTAAVGHERYADAQVWFGDPGSLVSEGVNGGR